MSSSDAVHGAMPADLLADLPAALPAMWRALKRGYDAEPRLLVVAFTLSLVAALPDALLALWLKFLADGLLDGDNTLVMMAALWSLLPLKASASAPVRVRFASKCGNTVAATTPSRHRFPQIPIGWG